MKANHRPACFLDVVEVSVRTTTLEGALVDTLRDAFRTALETLHHRPDVAPWTDRPAVVFTDVTGPGLLKGSHEVRVRGVPLIRTEVSAEGFRLTVLNTNYELPKN